MLGNDPELKRQELQHLQRAYTLVFGRTEPERDTAVSIVLRDLATICFAHEPAWDADARRHAYHEGRRSVWLHIQRLRNISNEELWSDLRRKVTTEAEQRDIHEQRFREEWGLNE